MQNGFPVVYSGLVIRMFAMRLMHLGKQAYVVGETTTYAIVKGDLLIAISGSGTSRLVCDIAQEAKESSIEIAVLTASPDAPLSRFADRIVVVPAVAKQAQDTSLSIQFAGSLFEQASLLLTGAIFQALANQEGKDTKTLWVNAIACSRVIALPCAHAVKNASSPNASRTEAKLRLYS